MANKDFDCNALLLFIEGTVGRSLNDIATEFGVSVRTVQRRLRDLRYKFSGLDIRECHDHGVKTYRCIRHGIAVSMGIKKRDIITLHRLRMAEATFRASGLTDHALAIEAHVESLMRQMPRAVRQSCQRELDRIAKLEHFAVVKNSPVASKGVADALQLACIARRKITAIMINGKSVHGSVEAMSYSLHGVAEATIGLQDGTTLIVALNEIAQIKGISDLIREDMIAA